MLKFATVCRAEYGSVSRRALGLLMAEIMVSITVYHFAGLKREERRKTKGQLHSSKI